MEKAIMISIKPKWVKKILSGEKTLEIRKTMPKCELPCKVYIYCSKGKESETKDEYCHLRGKVVAEFTLEKIDKLEFRHLSVSHTNVYIPLGDDVDYQWLKHSCIDYDDIVDYGKLAPLYAWHISNLKIYYISKKIKEFGIKRPPQSWCYVKNP